MHDLIIIGGGPAGVAGAVYAARKRLSTLLIATEFGGQSTVSEGIENWIGTSVISGEELAKNLKTHVKKYESETFVIKEGEKVKNISKSDSVFTVETETNTYQARAVLITSGSSRRKLEIPGASEFENKGITYCASCDGPLFADMDVAVIGGGNAAFESAAQLVAYCKSVTIIHRRDTFRADEVTVEKVLANPKIKAITNVELVKIEGSGMVSSLAYRDSTGNETMLPVQGIFVEIGQIPNSDFAKGVLALDELGRIPVDPRSQMTTVAGIWAAGDVTDGHYHQNNIAAGDAVKALEDIYLWLHKNK
jgi:alkyl hydroperoxide reductase subunit F